MVRAQALRITSHIADYISPNTGSADSMSYKHHLEAGARCVEIDAWNNEKDESEPKGELFALHLSPHPLLFMSSPPLQSLTAIP